MGGALGEHDTDLWNQQILHQNVQQQSNQDKQYHILFTDATLVEICLQNLVNQHTSGHETGSRKVADHISLRETALSGKDKFSHSHKT